MSEIWQVMWFYLNDDMAILESQSISGLQMVKETVLKDYFSGV